MEPELVAKEKGEAAVPSRDKLIVEEFCELLDKSKRLFDGLRDLPSFGQRHWQTHFGKTFDVFTKLWKFQQDNRAVLDLRYNLKRWQIGDIASRIGQLYYHYYLRTGEANYLYEAAQFYSAIRSRAYFSQANSDDKPQLVVKKLRYYARYLVVALLLNDMMSTRDLLQELHGYVDDYHATYCVNPGTSSEEWRLVVKEATHFIEADSSFAVVDDNIQSVPLRHRICTDDIPSLVEMDPHGFTLQEIIIVGNCDHQTKFSELTLDMYRMLQVLEYEPHGLQVHRLEMNHPPLLVNGDQPSSSDSSSKRNPHKYLLYKPSIVQLFTYLAAGVKELPAKGVLLLYMSADGLEQEALPSNETGVYSCGGVLTNRKKSCSGHVALSNTIQESNCFYSEDLVPFTRKPLVVIIDSPSSASFGDVPRIFGQPFVCLMSPKASLANPKPNKHGGIFTLFFYDPLIAICALCKVVNVSLAPWRRANDLLRKLNIEILGLLSDVHSAVDSSFTLLVNDNFLRIIFVRFVISVVVLRLHKLSKGVQFIPSSHPRLPSSLLDNTTIQRHVLDITAALDVASMFNREATYSDSVLV